MTVKNSNELETNIRKIPKNKNKKRKNRNRPILNDPRIEFIFSSSTIKQQLHREEKDWKDYSQPPPIFQIVTGDAEVAVCETAPEGADETG